MRETWIHECLPLNSKYTAKCQKYESPTDPLKSILKNARSMAWTEHSHPSRKAPPPPAARLAACGAAARRSGGADTALRKSEPGVPWRGFRRLGLLGGFGRVWGLEGFGGCWGLGDEGEGWQVAKDGEKQIREKGCKVCLLFYEQVGEWPFGPRTGQNRGPVEDRLEFAFQVRLLKPERAQDRQKPASGFQRNLTPSRTAQGANKTTN